MTNYSQSRAEIVSLMKAVYIIMIDGYYTVLHGTLHFTQN